MQKARELSIVAAANQMRKGDLTAEALLESCLERIHQREGMIHAWVQVCEQEALEEARRCDKDARAGRWHGDLHGIPIGVKDIIHVKGMWTRAGCSVYEAHVAESDASAVHRLRAAGAILLGKTETTPFANNDPTITRNPWNQEHTPGGSSSGSGAAVADRMCMAALGTQTGGSTLRPAAYNGIVGFKPTYGYISVEGVIPVAWSMDHVGVLARCVEDTGILSRLMRDNHPLLYASMPAMVKSSPKRASGTPPRLGSILEYFETQVSPEALNHFSCIQEKFKEAGAVIVDLKLPLSFNFEAIAHPIILQAELFSYHQTLFESRQDQYPPNMRARIEKGMNILAHQYIKALHQRNTFQKEIFNLLESVDAVFMPTADSTAPKGLTSTGSHAFCRPWTFSGFPEISIPSGLDNQGLPYGVQLASQPMSEDALLDIASWCEQVLAFNQSPL